MKKFMATAAAAALILASTAAEAQQRIGQLESWITVSDYPLDARAKGEQGPVIVSYKITPEGTVTDCKVHYTTASQRLAKHTCTVIEARARYTPARDSDGHAISGRDLMIVHWQAAPPAVKLENYGGSVPIRSPEEWVSDLDYNKIVASVGDVDVGIRFRIGPSGKITACGASIKSGNPKLHDYTCALVASRARFSQPVDENGKPMTTIAETIVRWRKPKD